MCIGKVIDSDPNIKFEEITPVNKKFIQDDTEDIKYSEDILSISTYYTKVVLFSIGDLNRKFYETSFYKILTQTTQPAHLITAIAVLSLAFLLSEGKRNDVTTSSSLLTLIYLASFSAHFGAQIWMTFVSGLALYFSLPRHTFGSVQKVLFPKYFLLNATLSLITLVVFVRNKNADLRVAEIFIQAIGMSVCFLIELVIRLYFTPPLLNLITEKNQIEKDAGVGLEVGKVDPGVLLNCPKYLKVHKKFRKVHMSIAIGNILTMACTMLHLYYLSQKLTLL